MNAAYALNGVRNVSVAVPAVSGGAVSDAFHFVPVYREDFRDEHAHLGAGVDHQDARGHGVAPRTCRDVVQER